MLIGIRLYDRGDQCGVRLGNQAVRFRVPGEPNLTYEERRLLSDFVFELERAIQTLVDLSPKD